uniref:Malate dehydrogenase n=1 Tax=Macrostomum lignano TaxID=282301 RepID=A0A1I8FQN0_9PLAT
LLQLPSAHQQQPWPAALSNLFTICRRQFTNRSLASRVAVLGASGGIGQPLSLLLKQSPLVSQLALYDIQGVKGVAPTCSHLHQGGGSAALTVRASLSDCLKGSRVVVIPAGTCPKAMICIVTNPVNSTVPIAAEILKKHNAYDPRRLFGVTTLDIVRSKPHLWPSAKGLDVSKVSVPVIGGHSGVTIIPVISQAVPSRDADHAHSERGHRGGCERQGRRRLRHAVHGVCREKFVDSVLQAIDGKRGCAFVESTVTEAPYFSTPLLLGRDGVEENLGLGNLIEFEAKLLQAAMPELAAEHRQGRESS